MAVTGQTQFSEITPEVRRVPANTSEVCAVIRMHGSEVEIRNGADPDTLESILNIICFVIFRNAQMLNRVSIMLKCVLMLS